MDLFNSAAFKEHVRDLMKEWQVPGLSMAFVQNDKISSQAFGLATIHPPKPCTPDTLFNVASSSKSLTAAAVASLVESEQYPKIQWKAKMASLLPHDFAMAEESYTNDITLEDILSHRTGLPGHDFSYLGQTSKTPDSAASVTRNLRNLAISAPIRSKYQYNNMMFTTATHLIETHTGMPFPEYLRKQFFHPLSMNSSFVQPSAAIAAGQGHRLVTPYSSVAADGSFHAIPWPEDPEAQGAGSICTSVNDYIVYIQALMHARSPFSKAILKEVTTPRIISETENLDPFESWRAYGFGWTLIYYRGYEVVRHFGGILGFASVHFFLPALGCGGVIFGNASAANSVEEVLMKELIDSVLDVPLDKRADWVKLMRENKEKEEKQQIERREALRKSLLGDRKSPEPLTNPLEVYTGLYHNRGYHSFQIEVKEGKLFVDATDRSFAFKLEFEHMHSQKVFIVQGIARDDENLIGELPGEFRFDDEDKNVVAIGLLLEPRLKDLIWFAAVDKEQDIGENVKRG